MHVCVDINILFTVLEEYEFNEASSREDTCIVEEKGRICIFCILTSIHLFFFLELRHLNTKVKFGMKTFVYYVC